MPSLSSGKSRDSADQQRRDPIIRQNTKKTKIRPKRIVLYLNSICECVSLLFSVQIIMNCTENIVIQNIRDATSQPSRKLCQASKDTQGNGKERQFLQIETNSGDFLVFLRCSDCLPSMILTFTKRLRNDKIHKPIECNYGKDRTVTKYWDPHEVTGAFTGSTILTV